MGKRKGKDANTSTKKARNDVEAYENMLFDMKDWLKEEFGYTCLLKEKDFRVFAKKCAKQWPYRLFVEKVKKCVTPFEQGDIFPLSYEQFQNVELYLKRDENTDDADVVSKSRVESDHPQINAWITIQDRDMTIWEEHPSLAKYSFASWVDAVALDRNIRMNAETFRKKTGVQAVVWTFMQGAMLSVCLDESGESYMNAIEELKEKTSTPSDVYSQIRKKINEKVDEMLFDSSNEDGMNQKLVGPRVPRLGGQVLDTIENKPCIHKNKHAHDLVWKMPHGWARQVGELGHGAGAASQLCWRLGHRPALGSRVQNFLSDYEPERAFFA